MIEFLFVSLLFVFMLSLTFNAVIAMSVQQYLSYAAFLSARAYQAGADNPQNQSMNAALVMSRFIKGVSPSALASSGTLNGAFEVRFPMFNLKPVAIVTDIRIPPPQDYTYGSGGVSENNSSSAISIDFKVAFVSLPLGPNFAQTLELEAKSYLGREATQEECRGFFNAFYQYYQVSAPTSGQSSARNLYLNMDDNGC